MSGKAFERVLDEFELDLDKKETATLTAAFDRKHDGSVHYMDFCDRLEVLLAGCRPHACMMQPPCAARLCFMLRHRT